MAWDSLRKSAQQTETVCKYPTIGLLKADNGYGGSLVKNLKEGLNVALECVESNFGTSEFKPINGRWVVERTLRQHIFSVLRGINYHRLGQSSCICVRLFRSQCNRIAPSLREHICTTLDRPGVNKYWRTGSKKRLFLIFLSNFAVS